MKFHRMLATAAVATVAAAMVALSLVGCDEARDWSVPAAWKPLLFTDDGREMIFVRGREFPREGKGVRPGALERIKACEASYPWGREMVTEVHVGWKDNSDGTFTTCDLDQAAAEQLRDPAHELFFVDLCPRVSEFPRNYLLKTVRHDAAAYARFLGTHPGFQLFLSGEWVVDAGLPLQKGAFLNHKYPKQRLAPDELASVLARPEYVHAADSRSSILTNLFARHLARGFELQYGDAKRTALLESASLSAAHIAAAAGVGAVGIETSRNYCDYSLQAAFCRGAARQFGIPWYWYVASFFSGVDSKGERCFDGTLFGAKWTGWGDDKYDPEHGLSVSAMNRVSYVAWLSGAAFWQREAYDFTHFRFDRDPVTLSDEGVLFDRFWHVQRANRRGVPYTPFALLVPTTRGVLREPGAPWSYSYGRKFGYTGQDAMLDLVRETIYDYRHNRGRDFFTNGVERVMANSKYGDLFDALAPDAPESFRRILPSYPCAILFGDEVNADKTLAATLRDYVTGGGTLVANVEQLKGDLFDFAGGKVLKADAAGRPLYTTKRVGRGTVIVSTTPWMVPAGADFLEQLPHAYRFSGEWARHPGLVPEIAWLFDELERRFAPVAVDGFVQWGINRVDAHWLLYLVNNAGVTKFGDTAEVLDPTPVAAEVDLSRIGPVAGIREITEGAAFARNGAILRTTVPSGGVRVFEIR